MALGFTGKAASRFASESSDDWFTSCVTIGEEKSLRHIVGDVQGKIHVYTFDNTSATYFCEKVKKTTFDNTSATYLCEKVRKTVFA